MNAIFGVDSDSQNGTRMPRMPHFGRECPFFSANAPRECPSNALPTMLRGVGFDIKMAHECTECQTVGASQRTPLVNALRLPFPSRRLRDVGIIHSAREQCGHGASQHFGLREGNNRGCHLLPLPAVAAFARHKPGSPTLEGSDAGTPCCSQSSEEWGSCSQDLRSREWVSGSPPS